MIAEEEASRKWSHWATHPERLNRIAELYITRDAAEVRAADLTQIGYTVDIILLKLRIDG